MRKTLLLLITGFLLGYFAWNIRVWISDDLPVAIATLPDSGEYFGPMENGRMHGDGKMVWSNGMRYEGGFKDGLFHGDAKLTLANGTYYEGEFQNGMMHGDGLMQYSDEHYYQGEFQHGRMHGRGKLVQAGSEHIGMFADDMPNGSGTWKRNGELYSGEMRNGVFHGRGMFAQGDGTIYDGEFINGDFTGEGRYSDEYRTYEGQFENWAFNGEGILRNRYAGTYRGIFSDGELNGEGTHSDGDTEYTGEFQNTNYHGKGHLVNAAGDIYEGQFEYGRYHGDGTLTLAEPVDGVSEIEGTWQYGDLISSAADMPIAYQSNDMLFERLIYNQHDLLQAAFDRLQPNDPDKTELYLLTIAGDGQERVFENEIRLVNDYFNQRFDTSARSISLVNSQRSIDQYPLATVESFQRTLDVLSEKMDPDNDILFIYMTSHGSREHRFSLAHNVLSLSNLPAEQMSEMLAEVPVKWKAIVVSACFSGGFIPPLADDNTLIMTAAAEDKTSFGCGDFTEYTYFGDALFAQALPQSADFVEAFDMAVELVTERELANGHTNSNPQIHKPEPIRRQLDQWRAQFPINTPVEPAIRPALENTENKHETTAETTE